MNQVELINATMGAKRLTNEKLAAKAKVTPKVVSAVRNGKECVTLRSFQKVIRALGLEMQITERRAA